MALPKQNRYIKIIFSYLPNLFKLCKSVTVMGAHVLSGSCSSAVCFCSLPVIIIRYLIANQLKSPGCGGDINVYVRCLTIFDSSWQHRYPIYSCLGYVWRKTSKPSFNNSTAISTKRAQAISNAVDFLIRRRCSVHLFNNRWLWGFVRHS